MSGPGVVPTLPSGSLFTQYYTEIEALTDAQGDPTNAITPNEGTVTVSGITDAGPASGATIQAFLFDYTVGAGLPEETDIAAKTAMVSATDLHETDSQGNELYSWSATLSTTGLAPGLYALQSFSYVPGFVVTNGVPVALSAYEDDQATVTVSEFVPYTYVVRADTEVVSVGAAQSDTVVSLPNANSTVQLSADGRYVVWTSGDQYEEDLQTGATIDLTTTGGTAPVLQTTLAPTFTAVGHPDPYGPEDNGGYTARNYPTFTEGGVTFGTAPDFDFNPNDGTENPLPTVTDAQGNTEVLAPFGVSKTMSGYAAAASDNGNAVLTVQPYEVSYFSPYSSNGISEDPQYNVVYRSPAPTLTLDPVNGNNEFSPGASSVTLTGTSNAIGQAVEIDFGQAGAAVGTATVQANGSWSYSFDASSITGSSLFIEASVMSAAGTPASVSETATISAQPPATITGIFGSDEENTATFGPGETLTIYVNTSAPIYVSGTPELTLSNGAVATYSYGSNFSQLQFTYVPAITDTGSSDLTITGLNLPGGATITDANGNQLAGSFDQTLGLTLQTVPVIESLYPTGTSSDFVTNSATPSVAVKAEEGETITLYDNGTVVGTGTTPYLGTQGITEVTITPTTALPEGQSTLTASATDSTGRSSALSSPVTITVDTIPPAETITGLAVDGNNDVTIAAQAGLAITVTGTLSTPLQPGESIVIVLPNGETGTVTPASGATSFSFSPTGYEAASFGAGGSISAYVMDAAGNTGASTTQSFTADSLRLIKLVSADPADPAQANATAPAISADGTTVAFQGGPAGGFGDVVRADDAGDITDGIYVETLGTGAVTLAQADGEDAALSGDGTILAYDEEGSSGLQVYAEDLTTGAVTLVSAADGVVADDESFAPSISADGTKIAFLSYADNLVAGVGSSGNGAQLYVATLSAGSVAGIAAVSIAADGTAGNGTTGAPALSGDGTEVAFSSSDTNLLAAGDPHTPNLSTSTGQIYVRALSDNTASGLVAGQVVLVSGNADGTVGNATSDAAKLSGNGRYVVFTSQATNLAPSNLASGATLPTGAEQVYVKDLLTGTLSLVSQTADGVVGDGYAQDASISSDGTSVVFSDSADNLVAGAAGEQLYAATLSNGVVTGLTLLSEPGAIPGDGPSTGAALSADGATVVFQSAADNLVAGTGTGEQVYETSTAATIAPPVTDIFSETAAATSGPYSGFYLWSNAANWSNGVPTAGASVVMAAVGVDDIAGLSLTSLNLSPPSGDTGMDGELLVEAGLTVGTLTIAASTLLEVVGSGTPNTLTITGSISAPQTPSVLPTIDADGAGAVVDDQEATTPQIQYIAQDGGAVELAGAVSAATVLTYSGGTFALAAPGATIAATLADVGTGDVLELPGTSVSAVTFGTNSISVTTDQGSFDFTNVTYAPGGVVAAAVTHDSTTGLEAITFVGADIFSETDAATSGPYSGSYLWSNAANWSDGVPTAGASVLMAAVGVDDIAGLSLTSLNLSPPTGTDGELFVEAGLTVGTLTIAASTLLEVVGSGTPNTLTITGSISAPQTPSVLPTIDADGAGAVVVDQEATTPQIQYIAQDGGAVDLAGALGASTVLTYGGGTFALAAPGATIAATLADVGNGDVLELPGTSVSAVTFGTNSISVTTDQGSFDFTNVTYAPGGVVAAAVTHDSTTGLEAITFVGADIFSETAAATSGPYSGSYLWSNAANWSNGVPTAGASVLMAAVGVDDIAGLSLTSLNLSPPTGTDGELFVEAGLTVGTLTIAASTLLDVVGSGAPNTLTITGSITAPQGADVLPTIDADGAGAVVVDQEATTPQIQYIAQDGGEVELAGALGATTVLTYGGGTFALAAPGATVAATLAHVAVGDVLELPGHRVQSATFGADSLTITTDEGTVDFTNVTFDGVVDGYTTMPDDATGLEAITFTGPDVFEETDVPASGFYRWSDAANWSQGVPTSGASVLMAGVSEDDIAGLSLTSLSVAPLPGDTGVEGQLRVDDDLTVYTLTVAASSEIDVVGGAQPTTLTVTGPATIDGTISTDPSTITFEGAVTGSGTIDIGAGSDVTFDGPVAATVTVDFLSNTGTLTIGDPSQFAAQIIGSGTEIVICYLRGTRVLTPGGEVPIETLARGDRLVTRFGGVQAIKWIGRQSFAARFIARNRAQWPVRIAAGALGPACPTRDLFVSPGHSMLIEDQLILARNLVNGITITQSQPTDDVHYYQVEFEAQDCILAEGAWSESYADDAVLRNQFHNVGEFRALFPDHRSPAEPVLCAPRPQSGPELEDALRPILVRAAAGLRPGPLRGWIDTVEPGRITGWAQDMAYPDMPVQLDLWLDDEPLGTILACAFREDLEAAGIGRGYCSFSFATAFPIPAASIRHLFICRAADGAALAFTDALQTRCG
jgi:hypothetical protein